MASRPKRSRTTKASASSSQPPPPPLPTPPPSPPSSPPSSPSSPPPPNYNVLKYTSQENATWAKERKRNKFLVEKTIKPSIDKKYKVSAKFHKLGWKPILQLKGKYYPKLVIQFYANIVDKKGPKTAPIRTWVKGKEIVVTEDSIHRCLRVPSRGIRMALPFRQPLEDPAWQFSSACHYFRVKPVECITGERKHRTTLYHRELDIGPRLVEYALTHNVDPKNSGTNELRQQDLYILDKMYNGLAPIDGILLAPFIFQSMRDLARKGSTTLGFVFPTLISRLLEANGVSTAEERAVPHTISDEVNDTTMERFFVRDGDEWANPYMRAPMAAEDEEDDPDEEMEDDEHDETAAPAAASSSSGSRKTLQQYARENDAHWVANEVHWADNADHWAENEARWVANDARWAAAEAHRAETDARWANFEFQMGEMRGAIFEIRDMYRASMPHPPPPPPPPPSE